MCLVIVTRLACGHIVSKKTDVFQCLNRHYHDEDPRQRMVVFSGPTSIRIDKNFQTDQNISVGERSSTTNVAGGSRACDNSQLFEIVVEIFDAVCDECRVADNVLPKAQRKLTEVPKTVLPDDNGQLRTYRT
jgi:hypothetical protein